MEIYWLFFFYFPQFQCSLFLICGIINKIYLPKPQGDFLDSVHKPWVMDIIKVKNKTKGGYTPVMLLRTITL
jgi:hypothetical protein